MNNLLTPKQVARAIGVSESSLKRWCDRGLLATERTAGGHRRLQVSSVISFLRQSGQDLKNPEVLGLPASSGRGERTLDRGSKKFYEALIQGQESEARHVLLDLYLANFSIASIIDEVIAPTFATMGRLWTCGEVEIYQERLGCQICMKLLYELGVSIPKPEQNAAEALGATPEGDHYTLAVNSVELVLRDIGWKATNLGSNLPFNTLRKALERCKPRVFWLSISHIEDHAKMLENLIQFAELASCHNTSLVLGGNAISDEIRAALPTACYPYSMTELMTNMTAIYRCETKLDLL